MKQYLPPLFYLAFIITCPATATPIEGPRAIVESTSPKKIKKNSILGIGSVKEDSDLRILRIAAGIDLPIPLPLLGGIFVSQINYLGEHRQASSQTADRSPSELGWDEQTKNLELGLLYLPHVKEGKPHFFTAIKRSADPSAKLKVQPMLEIQIGSIWDDQDSPWQLKFQDSDKASSRLEVRWRKFPGFTRWLIVIGHKIEPKTGLFLDVQAPVYGLIGWGFTSRETRIYSGWRYDQLATPIHQDEYRGWYDGHRKSLIMGSRWRLIGPVSIEVELGIQSEERSLYDQTGRKQRLEISDWGPLIHAAVKSWTSYP